MSLDCSHRHCIIIGSLPWSWLGVLRDDLTENWGKTSGGRGVLFYTSHIGMCRLKERGFGAFLDFAHFCLESGRVFEGSLGACERIYRFKGTGPRFSACSYIKMLFFCPDMLYRLCKQYDHAIMLSKNQSAHSPGSHLHLINLNICK